MVNMDFELSYLIENSSKNNFYLLSSTQYPFLGNID